MAKEIERKFLVKSNDYKVLARSKHHIQQGYLSTRKDATIRVRIKDESAFITIKGINSGITRDEWEYPIPLSDAMEMMRLSQGSIIDKTRYIVEYGNRIWEIDEFNGVHQGLILAEIELNDETETFPIPQFIGEEVTGNVNYYNSTLVGI